MINDLTIVNVNVSFVMLLILLLHLLSIVVDIFKESAWAQVQWVLF